MKKLRKWALPLACAAMATQAGAAAVTVLDFEAIAPYPNDSDVRVVDFYNGGAASNGVTGPDMGVTFTGDATLFCLATLGEFCSTVSRGGLGDTASSRGALYFNEVEAFMNVAAGFVGQLGIFYTAPFDDVVVTLKVFSGLQGSGTQLASLRLPTTLDGALGACTSYGDGVDAVHYCPFDEASLSFAGVARSVGFFSEITDPVLKTDPQFKDKTFALFDDIALTPFDPNVQAVPEPATYGLFGLGLLGLALAVRRQRRV